MPLPLCLRASLSYHVLKSQHSLNNLNHWNHDIVKLFLTTTIDILSEGPIFTVFRLLTDFVCLYNYEFWLSLCKIVRSSVILLLPLFITQVIFNLANTVYIISVGLHVSTVNSSLYMEPVIQLWINKIRLIKTHHKSLIIG